MSYLMNEIAKEKKKGNECLSPTKTKIIQNGILVESAEKSHEILDVSLKLD